jgi:hypothetical protein
MFKVNQGRKDMTGKKDIREFYREVLNMPGLTDKEIDQMRQNVVRLARAVCEHVWGRKFY